MLPAFADVTNALRETMITAAKIIYMNLRAKISQAKTCQTNHVFPALSAWTGVSLNGNICLVFAWQVRIPFPKVNCQPDSADGPLLIAQRHSGLGMLGHLTASPLRVENTAILVYTALWPAMARYGHKMPQV